MKGQVFDPIELSWDGVDYRIPAHRVMGAIHRVERVVTMDQLSRYASEGSAPLGLLSSAYGALLRYAGARITDDDIYANLYETMSAPEGDAVPLITLQSLMAMMLPPAFRRKMEAQALAAAEPEEDGEPADSDKELDQPGNSPGVPASSSPPRSKRR